MRDSPDRKREEVEAALHVNLERAREKYEKRKHEAAEMAGITEGTLGSADGTLAARELTQRQQAVREALDEYRSAMRAFADFVVHDKLPTED